MTDVTYAARNWDDVEAVTKRLRAKFEFGQETEERLAGDAVDAELLGVDVTFHFSSEEQAEAAREVIRQ